MTPREQLLLELFRRLEDQQVRYCVLRNFQGLLQNPDTDVDLLVEPADVVRAFDCLTAASTATDHRIILQNRFTCFSYVVWDGGDHLIRIDVHTEVRWRIFEVLSAREILEARCREGPLFTPHPKHEYVMVLLTAVWKHELQGRYRDRLTALAAHCPDVASWQRELVRAFGPMGAGLVVIPQLSQAAEADWIRKLRRSLIQKTLLTPGRLLSCFHQLLMDTLRLGVRLRRPRGIILKVFSPSDKLESFRDALDGFEVLFPVKKANIRTLSDAGGTPRVPWGLRWRNSWESYRCAFKGGLDLRFHAVTSNAELLAAVEKHCGRRHWLSARTFFCMVNESGRGQLIHVDSGLMVHFNPAEMHTDGEFTRRLVRFVCAMLDRPRASESASRRGLFCALVGLDGSGKTTLARDLSVAAANNPHPRFAGVRYFHWLPRPWKPIELPLLANQYIPHKPTYPASPVHMALSCIRLLRNLIWAHLAYALVVRGLRRRNCLVVLDRYFYNYILDPSSLKYSAPAWLLNVVLPLFPKPDVVILLKADPLVLQARKGELSATEMATQMGRLDEIKLYAPRCVTIDAGRPADQVVAAAFPSILEMASDHGTR